MIEAAATALLVLATLASACLVVRVANLVHAVLWLGVTLVATAALYATLGASFLAGVQVLVYVGGVVTLMIFGVMITRRHDGILVPAESGGQVRGALLGGAFFALLAWATLATPGLDGPAAATDPAPAMLGRALVSEHVLAFEALSVLLLGAMIGSIVIARRRDPGTASAASQPSESSTLARADEART